MGNTELVMIDKVGKMGGNLYLKIFDNFHDPVILLTTTSRIINLNKEALKLVNTGTFTTVEEIVGKDLLEVFPWFTKVISRLPGGESCANNSLLTIDATINSKERYFEITQSILDSEGEDFPFTALSLRDMMSHRQTAEELMRAREAAEAASHAKSLFLSTMSHEIRTPLNAIIGMAEVLTETPLSLHQQQFVETLNTAGENLMAIVNDILDISKIEMGHFQLEQLPFDLRELVEKTCEIFAVHAHKKNLKLVTNFHNNALLQVEGDPNRLRQILINLIGNAIKFTETGEIVVEVKQKKKKDKEWVTIKFSVSDTGIGIPVEKQNTIFKRFTQVDSSTTRKYGGTGLGLTIVRYLVRLMRGKIWVESQPNYGTRFTFEVFFKRQPPKKAGLEKQKKVPLQQDATETDPLSVTEEVQQVQHQARRILLGEDSVPNQNVVKAFLINAPVWIDIADNGKTALDKFKNNHYDLALMDIQMPIMDGLTAVTKIRAWEKETGRKATPIIAMTAHASTVDIDKSMAAGCNKFLAKPVKKKAFLQVLSKYLGNLQQVRSDDQHTTVPFTVNRENRLPQHGDHENIVVYLDPVLKPYIPGFIESVMESMTQIGNYLEQKNFDEIRMIAHKLKGDGGTYGFTGIQEMGLELQLAAENKQAGEIKGLTIQIHDYLGRVKIAQDKRKE
jgi:signal transduction histidine kinase/FixJ family two-component response regulator/HPt (histidine-containing phosphotransfer) domain-containing protein